MSDECKHCGAEVTNSKKDSGFCCSGCSVAYRFIYELGYEKFYQNFGDLQIEPVGELNSGLFEVYDQPEFQKKFVKINLDQSKTAKVLIGGLSCYACVWLINKAFKDRFKDSKISISLSSNTASITISSEAKLSEAVTFISQLGYKISPADDKINKSNLDQIIRLSIATFCFLNVMLASVPEYIDSDLFQGEIFWWIFRGLSVFFASIVISYGAFPIYTKAVLGMKQKRLVVEQSLSIAIVITYIFSLANVIRGEGPVYFDSVCAIVTLLGWGRYLQRRVMQNVEQSILSNYDYSMQYVRSNSGIIPAIDLSSGSRYFCLPGDPIPLNSRIIKGTTEISYELLTGESKPKYLQKGDLIEGGAINLSSRIELEADQPGIDSYIEKTTRMIDEILTSHGQMSYWSDRISSFFFMFILVCVGGIFIYHFEISIEQSFTRSIAALLIACPCAFAVAVPLAMARTTQAAMKKGIVFRNQKAIESLGVAKDFYFDKTGTLTYGTPSITSWEILNEVELDLIVNLAKLIRPYSNHHAVEALFKWGESITSSRMKINIENPKEYLGQGVEFSCEGKQYKLGKPSWCGTHIGDLALSQEGVCVAVFSLQDKLLSDSKKTIENLKKLGIRSYIISGDRRETSLGIGRSLGIAPENIYSNQSADEKMKIVWQKNKPNYVMIGNGYNDGLALASAKVGVAVLGSAQQARDTADIYLRKKGTYCLVDAVNLSRHGRKQIWNCYIFACGFNLVGLSLAAIGMMHPVVAASLMPVSSITVAYLATRSIKEGIPK